MIGGGRRPGDLEVVDVRDSAGGGSVSVMIHVPDDPTGEIQIIDDVRPGRPSRLAPRRRTGIRGGIGVVMVAWAAVLVGFVVFAVFLSAFPESRAQAGLQRHFSTVLANAQAPIGGSIHLGMPVARLDIPAIGLHQIVVEGTSAAQLSKGPGHVPVSPLPGQAGNSVIAAHALLFSGPFRSIASLRPGDSIEVLTGEGQAAYRVTGHSTVASNSSRPFEATRDNRLTLVTAANLWASSREVVTASLVGAPQLAPTGRPTVLAASQTALAGGGGGGLTLGLFLGLFLVVAALTVAAYRRLPRWSSYIITTPILLASLWLLYTTLGRFLPATI